MKITIYELLGMVKDGNAPKKIKVNGKVYINNNCSCYLDEQDNSLCNNVEISMFLNNEIEIIEEEKKIPEKLEEYDFERGNQRELAEKINEIIDYLKSKGE